MLLHHQMPPQQPEQQPQHPSHQNELDRQLLRHLMAKYSNDDIARLIQEERQTANKAREFPESPELVYSIQQVLTILQTATLPRYLPPAPSRRSNRKTPPACSTRPVYDHYPTHPREAAYCPTSRLGQQSSLDAKARAGQAGKRRRLRHGTQTKASWVLGAIPRLVRLALRNRRVPSCAASARRKASRRRAHARMT